MKNLLLVGLWVVSSSAVANASMFESEKSLRCWGDDNIVITLNAARTMMKYTVEGESSGAKRVTKTVSGNGYKSYTSEAGVLTLSKKSDHFVHAGDSEDDALELDCE